MVWLRLHPAVVAYQVQQLGVPRQVGLVLLEVAQHHEHAQRLSRKKNRFPGKRLTPNFPNESKEKSPNPKRRPGNKWGDGGGGGRVVGKKRGGSFPPKHPKYPKGLQRRVCRNFPWDFLGFKPRLKQPPAQLPSSDSGRKLCRMRPIRFASEPSGGKLFGFSSGGTPHPREAKVLADPRDWPS